MDKKEYFRKEEKDLSGTRYIYSRIINNTLTVCEVFLNENENVAETSLGFRTIAINEKTKNFVNSILSGSEKIEEDEFVEDLNFLLDQYVHAGRLIASKKRLTPDAIQ